MYLYYFRSSAVIVISELTDLLGFFLTGQIKPIEPFEFSSNIGVYSPLYLQISVLMISITLIK